MVIQHSVLYPCLALSKDGHGTSLFVISPVLGLVGSSFLSFHEDYLHLVALVDGAYAGLSKGRPKAGTRERHPAGGRLGLGMSDEQCR